MLEPTYVGTRQRKHLLSEELQPTYVVAHVKGSIFSAKSLSPPTWWRTSKEASSQRRASAHLRGGACQRKHLLEELQPTYTWWRTSKEAFSQRRASAHLRGGACQRKHLLSEELEPTYVVVHVKGSIFSAKTFIGGGARQRKHLLSEELQPTYLVAHVKGSIFSAKSLNPPTWWRTSKEASSQRRASAHLYVVAHVKGSLSEELQPTCVAEHGKASSQRRASAHLRGGARHEKHFLSEELQPTYVVAHVKGSIFSAKSFSPPTWWRTSKEASSQRRVSAHLRGGARHIRSIFSAKSFRPLTRRRASEKAFSD